MTIGVRGPPRADGELVTIGEPVVGSSARAPFTACCQIRAQMVASKISPP
ncbi:hypothetical protein [Streptomyces pseudovenezuelae]|uniref:Uncharacterized protein n=1 Tax=Streptomyces pseudovenezuelae TaxID=67350 RepID=A0ABT6LZY8_9ACTN|nr:hypothetical protein [Streptomyces pseudovenezuelae]MDH6221865.1 hypothetical protein [Streptomyces pseudovenezuelae]